MSLLYFIGKIKKYLTPLLMAFVILAGLQLQGCATALYLNSDNKRGRCDDERVSPNASNSNDRSSTCSNGDELLLTTAIIIDVMLAKLFFKQVKKSLKNKPTLLPSVVDKVCEAPTPTRVCTASSGCVCEP